MSEQTHPQPPPLSLAHILSDLSSLLICDPTAALALVSARPPPSTLSTSDAASTPAPTSAETEPADADPDITRAKSVVQLHAAVKQAHERGQLVSGLEEARRAVGRALENGSSG